MLKHAPSGSAASQQQQQQQHQHQHQQQQQQHQQHQQQQQQQQPKNLQSQQGQQTQQSSSHQIQHHHIPHVHPKQPPPPPPQIHTRDTRPNVVATTPATRAILNRSIQPLNVSTISHQTAPSIVLTPNKLIPNGHANGHANGALRIPATVQAILNATPTTSCSSPQNHCSFQQLSTKHQIGAREALTSLGLLCLVSLLLALLSLIFLLKISPNGRELPPPPPGPISSDDYIIVYDVTLALCALSLCLNLCCLLVCAIQFLFSVKLLRAPPTPRGNKFLQKSSVSRVCAVGGFFISIPIFLTGIILYTFTQFHSTPAIITSILIGVGIVFCGCAMVHNVFVWQREKTICVRSQNPLNLSTTTNQQQQQQQQTQHQHQHQHHSHSTQIQQQQQTPISTISSPQPLRPHHFPHSHSHSHHLYQNHNGIVNPATHLHLLSHHNNNNNNPIHVNRNHTPLNLTHTSQQIGHTTPVTPLSANHSHISFLPTPPTPKTHVNPNSSILIARENSGSVTPGTGTLDISNVTSTISPHELSTLV